MVKPLICHDIYLMLAHNTKTFRPLDLTLHGPPDEDPSPSTIIQRNLSSLTKDYSYILIRLSSHKDFVDMA